MLLQGNANNIIGRAQRQNREAVDEPGEGAALEGGATGKKNPHR